MAENMRRLWQSVRTSGSPAADAAAPVAEAGGARAGPGAAEAAPKGGSQAAPESTDTDLFFNHDSAELTASAQKVLDAHAKAYTETKSSETIVVDAYASKEGDPSHNQKLSDKRAQAVADYLAGKGVPKDKVAAKGRGATDSFDKDDLAQNRRATIKAPAGWSAPSPDAPPIDIRKPPKIDLKLPPDYFDKHPVPTTVPRAQVKRELEKFLIDLGQAQGHKTKNVVTSSDKVWQADVTLHKGLGATVPYTPTGGDKNSYQASELAEKIASRLPDEIPRENFENFLKLKPAETKLPGSFTEQLHEKYVEARERLVKKLPEKVQDLARKAIDAAVQKGVSTAVETALEGVDIDKGMKDAMKELVDDFVKKSTEGEEK
jgi:outer membrane protein OmpA-like peptidoglycan-associated protein